MTALCTHGVQTGAGYSCSACVTTPISPVPVAVPGSGVLEVEQDVDTWTDPEEGSGSMFVGADGSLVNPEATPDFEQEVARHHARLEAEAADPQQDWYFTFGHGQHHRITGEHLLGAYVVIHGTYLGARQVMVSAFGTRWCDQYPSASAAGVPEFKLRRIELPGREAPVTPAEERTGVSDGWHEVAHEVAFLRAEIMTGWWEVDTEGRDHALARLDRIESCARGEQR